jgi:hypothetical protein
MLHLIIILAVVGVLLYLLNAFVPMDAKIKTIINWVVVFAVVLWLLSIFGVLNMVDVPVPHIR